MAAVPGQAPEGWRTPKPSGNFLTAKNFVIATGSNVAPPPLGRLDPLGSPPAVVTGFITIDSLLAWNFVALADGLHHLMLPVATKVFVLSGPMIKMIRQNMVRALGSDYILYAESCGLPPRMIARYALRNSLAPALTLIGVLYGYVLGGAVLIETIFSLGGIGQYSVGAVLNFDYPAIQGVVLVITAVSLDCGYSASSIRERIYVGPNGNGILLYTASPGAEGSLGGLVEVGRHLERYLPQALDLGRLCSNDPVCSAHLPDIEDGTSDRHLEGASCHGCLLISEPSCERMNQYLDRTLVVPTVETSTAAFFQGT